MAGMKRSGMAAEEARRGRSTLADLGRAGVDVFCWCNRCGHNAVVPTARLMAELGPAFPVPEAGARMRCTGCGSKDVATRPNWPSQGQVARHS